MLATLEIPKLVFPPRGGYLVLKGLERGQNPKADRDRFLTVGEVNKVLQTIKESKHPKRERDHCALFMGFFFGLRVREASMIERPNFRFLSKGQVFVRRVKTTPRIAVTCKFCNRKFNVSAKRIGEDHECVRCGRPSKIMAPKGKPLDLNPKEKALPLVETKVSQYVQDYLEKLRPGQRWFFEGQHKKDAALEQIPHISPRMLERIFAHWTVTAGLSPLYSWHSLRHARGVFLYERFKDLKMVQEMLAHESISSTEFYMHISPERKEQYRKELDSLFETL